MLPAMKSGRARLHRAWFVSGIVATAAIVVGVGGPAPAQVEPLTPEVEYVDAFGPGIVEYIDCEGDVFTEDSPYGFAYIELDDEVEVDTSVTVSFSGSLADDLVDPPTSFEVAAGDSFSDLEFEIDAVEDGELTITVEPGLGYVAGPEDTYTLQVSTTEPIDTLACEDLGSPPNGGDRQTITVGETPIPLGFYVDEGEPIDPDEPVDTLPPPPTDPTTSTTEAETTTTEAETTTTSTDPQLPPLASPFAADRGEARAMPEGWDTLVANGSLPPGLTYVDDVWSGTASTAGTYAFDVQVCLDDSDVTLSGGRTGNVRRPVPRALPDVLCLGYVDVEIVVLAATTAGPASPVSAAANFAG